MSDMKETPEQYRGRRFRELARKTKAELIRLYHDMGLRSVAPRIQERTAIDIMDSIVTTELSRMAESEDGPDPREGRPVPGIHVNRCKGDDCMGHDE